MQFKPFSRALFVFILLTLTLASSAFAQQRRFYTPRSTPTPHPLTAPWDQASTDIKKFLADNTGREPGKIFPAGTALSDLEVTTNSVRARLTDQILLRPWRPDDVASLKQEFENRLPKHG